MEALRLALLFVHLLAIATLLGGLASQLQSGHRVVGSVTLWGARVAFLVGLLQVGLLEALEGYEVDHAKIGVKLVVAFVVVGMLESQRRKPALSDAWYYGALGLTVANVAVAVFWSPAHAVA